MYAGDSFYTLSSAGRIGLVILSVALTVGTLMLAWRMMRGRGFVLRLAIAAALFIAFVWLSPQIYYGYYLTLFDGLPWQSVIKGPPDPAHLWQIMSFTGPPTLSAHGLGALGWLLIVMALIRPLAASASRPDDRV